jgi:hypothetical protein
VGGDEKDPIFDNRPSSSYLIGVASNVQTPKPDRDEVENDLL